LTQPDRDTTASSCRETPHGEVETQSRGGQQSDWPARNGGVACPFIPNAEDADVELDEAKRLYSQHGLRDGVFRPASVCRELRA
jgi:hypothetical protein